MDIFKLKDGSACVAEYELWLMTCLGLKLKVFSIVMFVIE